MFEIIIKIIPVVLIFLLGYILKSIELFKKENGDLFLKVVFFISFPALIMISVTNIKLSTEFLYLPVISIIIIFTTFFISFFIGKLLCLTNESFGVFLTATLLMNTNFLLPFFLAAFGDEGLARVSIFDFGNCLLAFTFVYFIACKYSSNNNNSKQMAKKIVLSPPIWALIIAILLNLHNKQIPLVFNNLFQTLGNLTIPLVMLSLGIYFNPKIVKLLPLSTAIFIRILIGLSLGFIFANIFNLNALNKLVVLVGSSAPTGYNTITFASLLNLDKEFAASIVSISIFLGIIFIPISMYSFY